MVEAKLATTPTNPHCCHHTHRNAVGACVQRTLHAPLGRRSRRRYPFFHLFYSTPRHNLHCRTLHALHTRFSTRLRRAFVEGVLASIDRRERLEQESLKRRQASLKTSLVFRVLRWQYENSLVRTSKKKTCTGEQHANAIGCRCISSNILPTFREQLSWR